MSKEEYIRILKQKLASLPKVEIDNAVDYVREYYEECGDDEKAYYDLGDPAKLALQIKADFSIKQNELRRYEATDQGKKKAHANDSMKTILLIFLGILSLPLSLPLVMMVVVLLVMAVILMIVPFFILAVLAVASFASIIAMVGALIGNGVGLAISDILIVLAGILIVVAMFCASVALLLMAGNKFFPWLAMKLSSLFNRLRRKTGRELDMDEDEIVEGIYEISEEGGADE